MYISDPDLESGDKLNADLDEKQFGCAIAIIIVLDTTRGVHQRMNANGFLLPH
jgi:hypothetical protein